MAVTKETRDAITRIEKERLQSEADEWKQLRKDRQKYNLILLDELEQLILRYPDLRFGQIISSFFYGDNPETFFNDEPQETLKNVQDKVKGDKF